jgi:MFS family permease
MLEAVPRAAFMLVGGALTDRISPKRILILTAAARMLLVSATAALSYLHRLQLWHLYGLALSFGTADAFGMPAGQVLVPALLSGEQLPAETRSSIAALKLPPSPGQLPPG